jgi:hypothetical protein
MDAQAMVMALPSAEKCASVSKKQDGAMARNPAWPLPSAPAPHCQESGTEAE